MSTVAAEATGVPELDREHAQHLLREMMRIRRFEEKCAEPYGAEKIRGFVATPAAAPALGWRKTRSRPSPQPGLDSRAVPASTPREKPTPRGGIMSESEERERTPPPPAEGAGGLAEEARVQAEVKRAEAESRREYDSLQRSAHEQDRQVAEEVRRSAEEARILAEVVRDGEERIRQLEERRRMDNESLRLATEHARTEAEGARRAAEAARGAAEEARSAVQALEEGHKEQMEIIREMQRTLQALADARSSPRGPA
jgi:hypothetical protein